MPQSAANRSQAEDKSSRAGNKPVDKFTDGPVHVSIWENNGAKGAFRTATIELRYKGDHDQWQTGRSYSSSALLHLESAAREARARIEKWHRTGAPKRSPR